MLSLQALLLRIIKAVIKAGRYCGLGAVISCNLILSPGASSLKFQDYQTATG